jgi:hypothetical protein
MRLSVMAEYASAALWVSKKRWHWQRLYSVKFTQLAEGGMLSSYNVRANLLITLNLAVMPVGSAQFQSILPSSTARPREIRLCP